MPRATDGRGARGRRRQPRRSLRCRCVGPVARLRPAADRRGPADRATASASARATPVIAGARAGARRPRSAAATETLPEDIPLDVVYEDEDVLIVDKPCGPGDASGARPPDRDARQRAARRSARRRRRLGIVAGTERPGIVHRLDRDTSGLLMVARNDAAQASLQAQLKARRVKKTYLALVAGSRRRAGRPHRGAHRPRSAAPHADGRRARRARRHHRLPRPRAVRAAGRCWSSTWSPAAPTRSASTSRRSATRSPATRSTRRGVARRGPDGLERLFLHSWRLELVSPTSGAAGPRRGAAARRSWNAVLATLRSRRAGGERSGDRASARRRTTAMRRGRAGCARWSSSRARPGWARTPSSTPCSARDPRRAPPLRRHLHDARRRADEVDGVRLPLPDRGGVRRAARSGRAARGDRGPRQLVRDAARPGRRGARRPGATRSSRSTCRARARSGAAVPDALLIFVVPPSLEALDERLVGPQAPRSPESLERRRHDAARELARQGDYDHVVVNETDQVDAHGRRRSTPSSRPSTHAIPDRRIRV